MSRTGAMWILTAMVVLDEQQDPNEDVRIDVTDIDSLKHTRGGVRVGGGPGA